MTLIAAAAVLLGGVVSPQPVAAQDNATELSDARARLDTLFVPLEQTRASLDRRTFDVRTLGMDLAFEEADQIVEHVHAAVRFEPYVGLLRGAQGTLASGGGNSLDQALLTTVLLLDAGYEAQIWGATLTDEQVVALLGQVGAGGSVEATTTLAALQLEVDYDEMAADIEALTRAVEADVQFATSELAAAMPDAGSSDSLIVDAARDYYWVAYRMFAGDPWNEAHPVFGAVSSPFEGLEHTLVLDGEIPAELQHRFSFQVFVERRLGDSLSVTPVTALWERPVANMYGVALTYANVPDGLEAVTDASDTAAVMSASNFFYPMLNGDVADGGQAFDIQGNVVPPEAASSPYAALFQTVGGAMGSAFGALSGLGADPEAAENPDDLIALTAQWIEFTFTAPGQQPVTHRRMVVDRLGAEARTTGTFRLNPEVTEADAFAALSSVHTFMLDPGRYAESYVLDRSLDSVLAMRSFVDQALVCAIEGTSLPPAPAEISEHEAPVAPLYLYSAFQDVQLGDDVISYRPAPGLVVMSQRLDGTGAQVDVIANPRWSLRTTAGGVEFDAEANRLAGVWETRVESLPLARGAGPVTPAFAALQAAQGGVTVISSADIDQVAQLPLPFEARAGISEDLLRGYTVVVPTGYEPQSLAHVGWWRTDPVTGETLGRGGDGRGSAFIEYLTSFEVSIAITAGFTVYGVHQCTSISDPRIAGCCIVQNVAMAGVGTAVGVGLGVVYGASKALVIFGVMDIGANVAGLFVPTVCS